MPSLDFTFGDLPEPGPVEILDRFIDLRLARIHTVAPGRVLAFDSEKQRVDVQPLLMTVFLVNGVEQLEETPVLKGVPVYFPRAGGFVQTWDVHPGDVVLMLFCERSIDSFKKTGQLTDPTPRRRHDISDAIALCGFSPDLNPIPGMQPNQLRIGTELGDVEVVLDNAAKTVTVEGLEVKLGKDASQGIGRVGDSITIDTASDPAFTAWLSALSPTTVAPYTASITGRITSGSTKAKAE